MSTGTPASAKDWLQELKTNRKTQASVAGFAGALIFMGWMLLDSDKPKAPKSAATRVAAGPSRLEDRQEKALDRLSDLAQLRLAGELPSEERVARDPFLFEGVGPDEFRVFVPPPPPPPKTEEELARERLEVSRKQEQSTAPKDLRYIGSLGSSSRGIFAAFMKGEEAFTYPLGSSPVAGWKLVKIEERYAEFQNLKYADISFKAETKEGTTAAPGTKNQVINDF